MITNTYLIAKHLPLLKGNPIKQCAMCDAKNIDGFPKKQIISASFMDDQYIRASIGSICIYCTACLGRGQERNSWIRCTSFLAAPSKLLRLKREDIWYYLFNPPDEPFVFGVTYSHKKHISFKCPVNLPKQKSFRIATENTIIEICPEKIIELAEIMQDWYTACKDIKTAPTWFTKDNILLGCFNFKRIEDYGTKKYLQEDEIIKRYRHTALLQLLTHALNKKGYKK